MKMRVAAKKELFAIYRERAGRVIELSKATTLVENIAARTHIIMLDKKAREVALEGVKE